MGKLLQYKTGLLMANPLLPELPWQPHLLLLHLQLQPQQLLPQLSGLPTTGLLRLSPATGLPSLLLLRLELLLPPTPGAGLASGDQLVVSPTVRKLGLLKLSIEIQIRLTC